MRTSSNVLRSALATALVVCSMQIGVAQALLGVDENNQLVRFNPATPGTIDATIPVTGLQAGETILGIDVRPATGELYALGSTSHVYRIGYSSGTATEVTSGGLTTALSGTEFGFDFNPVADRIRVVSNTGQNLRVNPTDGSVSGIDTSLSYAPGDANEGASPNVVGAAYDNNQSGASSTSLYDIDSALDVLVTQGNGTVSPNNGQLFTVGPLGVDVGDVLGFEISAPSTETAYASVSVGGATSSTLITVNIVTGAATSVGTIGASSLVRGLTSFVDSDKDGVPDGVDQCANTPAGQPVDDTGCPIQAPTGVDYTGTVLTTVETCTPPDSTDPKCKIKVKYMAQNIGTAPGPKTIINFYLSDDATFDSGDLLIRTKNVKLKAGKSTTKKFTKTNLQPFIGGKFVIARIDPNNTVGEVNEDNNENALGPLP